MSTDYPIVISALSEEGGGGYIGVVPDLIGCVSDGETPEEALANVKDAIVEWIATHRRRGLEAPEPGSAARRERDKYERLLKNLREIAVSVDHLNLRLDELEVSIREIEAKLENEDAWHRFADITGAIRRTPDARPRLV
jgi:antitoxin HicB